MQLNCRRVDTYGVEAAAHRVGISLAGVGAEVVGDFAVNVVASVTAPALQPRDAREIAPRRKQRGGGMEYT